MNILLIITIFIIVVIEFLLQLWVNKLRQIYNNSFSWKKPIITNIITFNRDKNPEYLNKDYIKHMVYFYDRYLGTSNKPNTNNVEAYYHKNKRIVTKYSIGKNGERKNNVFKKSNFSSYGDSLCFGRYVDDNNTWQYYLSKKLKNNVKNFGVGNYGLDQAFLKFKKNKEKNLDKSKNIIFLFGPEIIRRNVSLWKHFYEFGNIFNTKPAFIYDFKSKRFNLIKNPNCKRGQGFDFKILEKKIYKKDIFFKKKFSNYIWKFPYILSLRKYPLRKITLVLFFTYINLKKNYKFSINFIERTNYFKNLSILGGLYYDFIDKVKMYEDNFYLNGTKNVIKLISNFCKKNKIKCYFFLVPSYYDHKYCKKYKKKYYKSLKYIIENNNKTDRFYDLTNELIKFNSDIIYADKAYGGHLNSKGQKVLSNIIFKIINEKKIKS